MRIAIVAPPWLPVPPPAYGGTEVVLDRLARGVQAAGHEVMLFATGDSTCRVPTRWVLEQAAGTVATGAATEIRHVIHAYEAALEWGADVVHDHTLVGPLYAQRLAVPVVTTNHGPFTGELRDFYAAIAGSVPVVALSRNHAASAGEIPVAAVIYHGVDVNEFPVGKGDGDYAAFLGRMSPDKGVHIAARAARRAGVQLRIAAKMREPAEFAYFESDVKPLLGGGVEYVGEVGGQAKLELLARATCLLNPLTWPEPFGMVMIEALACGTPVVATPCGSAPELVVDGVTGFICASEGELADAMRRACGLDRSRCRADVLQRFNAARMAAEHIQLYETAATRPAPELDTVTLLPARPGRAYTVDSTKPTTVRTAAARA